MYRSFLILLIITLVLVSTTFFVWKEREREIISGHLDVQEAIYNTTIKSNESIAAIIFSEVINKPEILEIVAEAVNADRDRQTLLRGRLYRLLYEAYNRLVEINFRHLHIHLPDTTSFIRFHRLEKYGDLLADIRPTVLKVNTDKIKIFGFELGKIFNGFRYVFPLYWKEEHVGSVETSISFAFIQESMVEILPEQESLFVLSRAVLEEKSYSSELEIYIPFSVNSSYVIEDMRMAEDPASPVISNINDVLETMSEVQIRMAEEISFGLSVNSKDIEYIVSFLPIKNITGRHVAYVISYIESNEIPNLWRIYHFLLLGIFITVFIFVFFILQLERLILNKIILV